MAVDVIYNDNGRGVCIRQSGVVTGKEILAAQKKVFQQHLLKPQQYHMINKSWCTEYAVTAVDIETISHGDKKFAKSSPDMIMAVVESKILQFNLTKLWQAHIENDIKFSNSFSNQINALKWVNECRGIVQSMSFLEHKTNKNYMMITG